MSVELKIVLVGSSSVGKTTLTQRFATNEFLETTQTTIGAAFVSRQIVHRNFNINLQLWDTAGQERLRSILGLYYRKAHAVLLCYDLNEGPDDLPGWLQDIHNNCPQDILITIAATKSDIIEDQFKHNISEGQRVINDSIAQASEILQYEGFDDINVIPTSSRTGKGINEVFVDLIDKLLDKYQRDLESMNQQAVNTLIDISQSQQDNNGGNGCC
jgi:Ras-related protein Rab-5C